MNKEKTLLILWVIFGFVFIQAIDSALFLFTHLVYFGTVSIGVSYSVLNFILPTVTISAYLATIIILLKRIKIDSPVNGILLTKFPKQLFLTLLIMAVVLNPITNKLSGLFAEYNADLQLNKPSDFIEFYGWMHMGIGIGRWISLITIGIIYLNKYDLKE
jgi:hypothetical protein